MNNNLSHIFNGESVRYAFDNKGYSEVVLVAKDGTRITLYDAIVKEFSRFKVMRDIYVYDTHYLYVNIKTFI